LSSLGGHGSTERITSGLCSTPLEKSTGKLKAGLGQRRALLATLVFAGLRLGELLALRWSDVDVARGTIRVGQAKTDAGVRIVNVLPALRDELLEHKVRVQDGADGLVFATRTGRPLGATNVRRRVLRPAAERASAKLRENGLEPLPAGLTPHSLRRTFASLLFALGESPPYVMSQLGHATAMLTLALYAREMSRRDGESARLRILVEGEQRKKKLQSRTTSTVTKLDARWRANDPMPPVRRSSRSRFRRGQPSLKDREIRRLRLGQ
jgi:hypothetical protein